MNSIWTESVSRKPSERLRGTKKTDVLIIGGGMAGILTAFLLERSGVSTILLEARNIGGGITADTTAKITSQHGLCYDKMLRRFGEETAKGYLSANEEAVNTFRELCKDIKCDFEDQDSFVYSRSHPERIERECKALSRLGFNAPFAKNLPLPFSVAGAVKFSHQAQFHPLKFIHAIAQKLTIYENTPVREVTSKSGVTDHGEVFADKIIVATHFPFLNRHGSYFLKLYQERSYVLALENAQPLKGMYIGEDEPVLSFRSVGNKLLLGGGGHRTGKSGGGWSVLEKAQHSFYPNARDVSRWATQDCMTLDDIPYIGHYSLRTPNLFVATGFNKWGMTSSMAAAKLLCDMVLEKENPYKDIFSPSRSILRPQLAVNGVEAVLNLLTPTKPRCPHLGCALKYNKQEHSWDCPCHGSRFTQKGKLIDNPSTGNIKPPQ